MAYRAAGEAEHPCTCGGPAARLLGEEFSRSRFLAASGSLAAVAFGLGSKAAFAESATSLTIFTARKIVTMEPGASAANAVAVDGDTIAAVGALDAVQQQLQKSGRTYTIDRTFDGKVIAPGFVEHHLHPLLGVLSMSLDIIAIEDWSLPGYNSPAARNEAEYRSRLKRSLAAMSGAPAAETLFTWGFHQYFHGDLYRPQLDEISPHRPIVTWHRSCHEFILNTAALRKYGVTEATLQGRGVSTQQSSWRNGHFYEKGMEIIVPLIAKDLLAPGRTQTGLQRFKTYLVSKGITTICEPGTQMDRKFQSIWENVLNTDDCAFRTYFVADGRALYDKNKRNGTLAGLVEETASYATWGRGKVQWIPKHVKLFADGAIFSQLMQVQQPYLDGHKGEWIAEPSDYAAAFKAYWDAGYRIHTHVNGDEGLRVVIATLEANLRSKPRDDHRFTVVHFAISTEDQVAALTRANAVITANPYYTSALADKYSEFGLGPERANAMVRSGSVSRAGMALSLHSDMPMAPADPLFLAWCAVNRTTVSGRTADANQRISVDAAMRAITIESAAVLDKQSEIGSIRVGKRANFAILGDDPYAVDPAQIKGISIWGVVFEGRKFMTRSNVAPDQRPNLKSGSGGVVKTANVIG